MQSNVNVECKPKYVQEPDESLSERLWGLSEMFPQCLRNGAYSASTKTWFVDKLVVLQSNCITWAGLLIKVHVNSIREFLYKNTNTDKFLIDNFILDYQGTNFLKSTAIISSQVWNEVLIWTQSLSDVGGSKLLCHPLCSCHI